MSARATRRPGSAKYARFDDERLAELTRNALAFEFEDGFAFFRRFTALQMRAYTGYFLHEMMSKSSAGAYLTFRTTGSRVRFSCRRRLLARYIPRMLAELGFPRFLDMRSELLHGGRKRKPAVGMLDGFDVYANDRLVSSPAPRNGVVKVELGNEAHESVTVRIYLPLYFEIGIKGLEADGEIEPLEPSGLKMICLGDSITQGFVSGNPSLNYVARVARAMGADALNQGIGGFRHDRAALDDHARLPRPALVTVAYGTNDWTMASSLAEARAAVHAFYNRLGEVYSGVPTVVLTPIWRADIDSAKPAGRFEDIVALIRDEASRLPGATVIDGLAASPKEECYFADGWLHPNTAGFAYLSEKIIPQIMKAAGVVE